MICTTVLADGFSWRPDRSPSFSSSSCCISAARSVLVRIQTLQHQKSRRWLPKRRRQRPTPTGKMLRPRPPKRRPKRPRWLSGLFNRPQPPGQSNCRARSRARRPNRNVPRILPIGKKTIILLPAARATPACPRRSFIWLRDSKAATRRRNSWSACFEYPRAATPEPPHATPRRRLSTPSWQTARRLPGKLSAVCSAVPSRRRTIVAS